MAPVDMGPADIGAISLPSDHAIRGGVRTREPHDSGAKHTSGEAVYIDDIAEPPGLLAVHIAMSESAHAGVRINVDKVAGAPGIALVLAASDIPGVNDVSPLAKGEDPIFADGLVEYRGQSLFAVAANSIGEARVAASHAVIEYDERPAILTIDQAMEAQSLLEPAYVMARGDADAAIEAALHVLSGRIRIGGQEHFYLEGQVALAVPGEDEDIIVHSSTQHPSEIQK